VPVVPSDQPDLSDADRAHLRDRQPAVQPIGYVRSRYTDPSTTPIQSLRNPAATARVEVFDPFRAGLAELAEFDYAWVISWLDRSEPASGPWRVVPFMLQHTGLELGTFATRHPRRPNPLGLSVVRVIAVDGTGIEFGGVDLCHGTPVLDFKPWQQHLDIPQYGQGWDAVRGIRGGWYESTGAAEAGQVLPDGS
jgi:tRNA (adenine37-N6)-methyltransferase